MENEKLFLALRAGARAIVNNKRLHGAIYCWDIWGESGGPKEIPYLEAAMLLAETADKMENHPPKGEEEHHALPNEPLTQADIDKMHFDRVWIDYGVDDSGERCGEEGVVLYGKLYDIDTLDGSAFEDLLLDACDGETLDRPSGDYKVYRRTPEGEANGK